MSRKPLVARWSDPAFVLSVNDLIESILAKETIRGPGVDLRGISIGSEGPVERLWDANLTDCRILSADLSHGHFEGGFERAVLEDVDLSFAAFERCRMHRTTLRSVSLVSAKLKTTSMDDAVVEECDLQGATLRGKGIAMGYGGRRTKFHRCDFRGAKLVRLEFRAVVFEHCRFDGALFDKCVLQSPKFVGAAPGAEQFVSCEVRGATADGVSFVV